MPIKRTTFTRDFLGKLSLSTTTKLEILAKLEQDEQPLEELRRAAPPAARVTLGGLVRTATPVSSMAKGTMVSIPSEAMYRDLQSVALYDLRDVDRVDVIRVGRHPDQDLGVLDQFASREHGLVIFDSMVFYFDYGTMIESNPNRRPQGRHGSLNGSYLNGELRISNGMVPWFEEDTIHLGSKIGQAYAFKLAHRSTPPEN
jgi:hypothetical protein